MPAHQCSQRQLGLWINGRPERCARGVPLRNPQTERRAAPRAIVAPRDSHGTTSLVCVVKHPMSDCALPLTRVWTQVLHVRHEHAQR